MNVTITVDGTPSEVSALLRELKKGETRDVQEIAREINDAQARKLRLNQKTTS